MTPEQRKNLSAEELVRYDSLSTETQAHWDNIIQQAEDLEKMSPEDRLTFVMEMVASLIIANNQVTERVDQLVDVVNHHSSIITLLVNTVNNMGHPMPAPESTDPQRPAGGQYL